MKLKYILTLLAGYCLGVVISYAATGDFHVGVENTVGAVQDNKLTPAMVAQWQAMLGAQQINATSAADGTYTWTFSTPFGIGITPCVLAVAQEGTAGVNTNIQVTARSNTSVSFRVTRLANVLGVLTITSTQATSFSAYAIAP